VISEVVVRQHIRHWFGPALWLVPVVGLCGWAGTASLPARGERDIVGALCSPGSSALRKPNPASQSLRSIRTAPVDTLPGMPPVANPSNLYSAAGAGRLSPAVGGALSRIYVPNLRSNDVYVIDPQRLAVVDRFKVGAIPQHVVPSWDLQTLWVANNGTRRRYGSLTPVDPKTGKPGQAIAVDDPYNLYFTPDGRSAIVVAERRKRLDFRDPHTMALQQSVAAPGCSGINHADFSIDGHYAIFT